MFIFYLTYLNIIIKKFKKETLCRSIKKYVMR